MRTMAKYEEIAEDIRNGILSGKYNSNEQLPLEKEMCEYYGVSRITIKKAVDELQKSYPDFFKNLSEEEILTGKAADERPERLIRAKKQRL